MDTSFLIIIGLVILVLIFVYYFKGYFGAGAEDEELAVGGKKLPAELEGKNFLKMKRENIDLAVAGKLKDLRINREMKFGNWKSGVDVVLWEPKEDKMYSSQIADFEIFKGSLADVKKDLKAKHKFGDDELTWMDNKVGDIEENGVIFITYKKPKEMK